jgi:hypothetical protein
MEIGYVDCRGYLDDLGESNGVFHDFSCFCNTYDVHCWPPQSSTDQSRPQSWFSSFHFRNDSNHFNTKEIHQDRFSPAGKMGFLLEMTCVFVLVHVDRRFFLLLSHKMHVHFSLLFNKTRIEMAHLPWKSQFHSSPTQTWFYHRFKRSLIHRLLLISRSCWKTCFTILIFQGVLKFGNLKTASKHDRARFALVFYWKTNKEESCKSKSDRVVFLCFHN